MPKYEVHFYQSPTGNEPVLEWLRSLSKEHKKAIGEDIMVLQFRWPMGMPLVRKMAADLWELRTRLKNGIARIFFTIVEEDQYIVLLHGFMKKSQKTRQSDLDLAKKRLNTLKKSQ